MTKTFTQAAAIAFAALVTATTFAGADAMAKQEYVKADAVATARVQVLDAQAVVIVGQRA